MAETKWQIAEPTNTQVVSKLQSELGVREDVAQLLENRGIADFESARRFFRPDLSELHNPFLMKGMQQAVNRLEQAFGNGEKILIYGDYDVDGTTSVALVYSFLKDYGQLDYYIPDRYAEGYGLSIAGIDFAKANDFSLIITLDCGIKAVEKVAHANKLGVDIIICDHHLPGSELPQAIAILDPKQNGCNYPYKELCGCGVGFKLLQAFCQKNGEDVERLYQKLDLVAIAIAADIVPITGENRVLTSLGINQLNTKPSVGVQAILEHTKIKCKLTISDVVFIIAPRINAAGRIASGKKAVELLISDDKKQAEELSARIDIYNTERRALDKDVTQHALQLIEQDSFYNQSHSTVVFHPDWHKGVVGIVASRIIENHYRPTIVLTQAAGMATGSARSVAGFDVHAALCQCEDILQQFGGHKYAAGMSLKVADVSAFRHRFEEVVSQSITKEMLTRKLNIDLEIDLGRITPKFASMLQQFAPFGPQNLNPVFISRGLLSEDVGLMGADRSHLRFRPKQNGKPHAPIRAVAFKMAEYYGQLMANERFDLAYSIEENHWNGNITLQLNVKGIRFI